MRTLMLGLVMTGLVAGTAAMAAGADRDQAVQYFPLDNPGAPISAAVRVGEVLYLSGQVGLNADGTVPEGIAAQTRIAMDRIVAILDRAGLGLDHLFKCSVMLTDMNQWADFNKVYVSYFKPDRLPARSAFGVSDLVRGVAVEIECMAHAPARPHSLGKAD